jgi:hypothetical protein
MHHCLPPTDHCFTVKTCQFLLKPPEKWTIDDDNNDDEPVPIEQDISDPDFQPSTSMLSSKVSSTT